MSSHCIIRHGTAFFAYVQIAFTDFKEDLDIPSFSIDTDEEVEICLSFWLSCVILLFIAWASGFNCFSTTQLYRTRWFHAILLPVIIEFSRCIGTYSSAKFELYEINQNVSGCTKYVDIRYKSFWLSLYMMLYFFWHIFDKR